MTSAQQDSETNTMTTTTKTTLVLGATGATGKWVVKQLLDQGQSVRVVVQSKERLLTALKGINDNDDNKSYDNDNLLSITEDSLLDMSEKDLQQQVQGCNAVVSCLGHNLNMEGLWGRKGRRLVTDMVKRVTKAIATADEPSTTTKFILMGSDGVANPNGQDDKRTLSERIVLFLLRNLIPPHADNEAAAAYLHSLKSGEVEWSVVRPTDLIDGPPTGKYQLLDKPQGGLFGAGVATRSHVAHSMVNMIMDNAVWEQYKYQMPVLHDITTASSDDTKTEL